jgi:pimeloyl-ACP methyl ester carboxylesterase
MLREHVFDLGEATINYAEGPPSGPPLVLVHGLPGRWQEFLPIIPTLAARWHIYALDLRGQGRSGRAPGRYLPGHYTGDVTAFLQGQLAEPAMVFGMSAGGLGALSMAASSPERVRALVIGDSPIDMEALASWMSTPGFTSHFSALRELAGSGRSVRALAKELGNMPVWMSGLEAPPKYRDVPGMDSAHLRDWAKMISQLDPDVLEYHAEGRGEEFLAGIEMDAILQQITCPVLLLRANPELEALMSAQAADHALSLLPDGIEVLLETAGHDLGLDSWDVGPLLRAVTDFLESI